MSTSRAGASAGVRNVVVIVAVAAIALAISGAALVEVNGGELDRSDTLGAAVLAISFVAVGAVVTALRSNAVGWVMLISGCFNALNAFVGDYSHTALQHGLPFRALTAWLSAWVWVGGAVGFPLVLLLFPSGRPPSRRWWLVAAVAVGSAVAVAMSTALAAWSVAATPVAARQLYELLPDDAMRIADTAVSVLGAAMVASGLSLVMRYRRGGHVERQQIKWLFVAGVMMTLVLFTASPAAPVDLTGRIPLLSELAFLALAAIPAAIGVAILRYRLYDIDVVINRALVYSILTVVLGAVYVAIVFALQSVLAPVTARNDLAIAASTLAVAALFGPLRRWVQDFIDRRFYRRKFDAQRTLEEFSNDLRDEVDLASLSSRLTSVVTETMQPAHVSLWVRRLGAREASR